MSKSSQYRISLFFLKNQTRHFYFFHYWRRSRWRMRIRKSRHFVMHYIYYSVALLYYVTWVMEVPDNLDYYFACNQRYGQHTSRLIKCMRMFDRIWSWFELLVSNDGIKRKPVVEVESVVSWEEPKNLVNVYNSWFCCKNARLSQVFSKFNSILA